MASAGTGCRATARSPRPTGPGCPPGGGAGDVAAAFQERNSGSPRGRPASGARLNSSPGGGGGHTRGRGAGGPPPPGAAFATGPLVPVYGGALVGGELPYAGRHQLG